MMDKSSKVVKYYWYQLGSRFKQMHLAKVHKFQAAEGIPRCFIDWKLFRTLNYWL